MGRTASPSRGRRIPRLLAPGLLLAAATAALLPSVAPAQDSRDKPANVKRLKFEYKCHFEEFKGQAEVEFLTRLSSQRNLFEAAKSPDLPQMEDLLAGALWARVQTLQGLKQMDAASTLASEMGTLKNTTQGVKDGIQAKADDFNVSYSLQQAKQDEGANDGKARQSYRNATTARQPDSRRLAVEGLVRIAKRARNYEAAIANPDLMEKLKALETILADLQGDMPKEVFAASFESLDALKGDKEATENNLGFVRVTFFPVALPGYRLGASDLAPEKAAFSLAPAGPGAQPWPPAGGAAPLPTNPKGLALYRGTYDIRVFLDGAAKEPVALFFGVVVGKEAPIGVPSKIPDGMVFVPPVQGGEGFFIDITETTLAQVEKSAGSDARLAEVLKETRGYPGASGAGFPAWFFEEEQARAWELATGKKVPTVEQWLRAAYGPFTEAQRRYPWGVDAPKAGVHFFSDPKVEEPRPVGSCPDGRSPYGLLDMVGNLAEWVVARDGSLWVLGGHYQQTAEVLCGSLGKSFLREPAPGPKAFKAMANQGEYTRHNYGGIQQEGFTSGLRMALPAR